MANYIGLTSPDTQASINVKQDMFNFLTKEALPANVDPEAFKAQLANYFLQGTQMIQAHKRQRRVWQQQIDAFYKHRRENNIPENVDEELAFLRKIGYIVPEGEDFKVTTKNVPPEFRIGGLQSVSPVIDKTSESIDLNATLKNTALPLSGSNGRWGDYVKALLASDVIKGEGDERLKGVSEKVLGLLKHVPLENGASWSDATSWNIVNGELRVVLKDNSNIGLSDPSQAKFITGGPDSPSSVVFSHNGLHFEIKRGEENALSKTNALRISGCDVEANITAIDRDIEDGSTVVGEEDELTAYRTIKAGKDGTLQFHKAGEAVARRLLPNRVYTTLDGKPAELPSQSVSLVRVRGLEMETDTITDAKGNPQSEMLLDILAAAMSGARIIVVPKLDGPEAFAIANWAFTQVEKMLGLPENSLLFCGMNEDIRTSLNQRECWRHVKDRGVMTNTGYLDWNSTYGDTFLEKGETAPAGVIKAEGVAYNQGYEPSDIFTAVELGIDMGGKGMATATKLMSEGLAAKLKHAEAGANASWPHSPQAGQIYVEAWHTHDVADIRAKMAAQVAAMTSDQRAAKREDFRRLMLTFPHARPEHLTAEAVDAEVRDYAHSSIAYAEPWMRGIGCAAIPTKKGVVVMEDCATVAGKKTAIRNRIHYGRITENRLDVLLREEAAEIDRRNVGVTRNYRPLTDGFDTEPATKAVATMMHDQTRGNRYVQTYFYPARTEARRIIAAEASAQPN